MPEKTLYQKYIEKRIRDSQNASAKRIPDLKGGLKIISNRRKKYKDDMKEKSDAEDNQLFKDELFLAVEQVGRDTEAVTAKMEEIVSFISKSIEEAEEGESEKYLFKKIQASLDNFGE